MESAERALNGRGRRGFETEKVGGEERTDQRAPPLIELKISGMAFVAGVIPRKWVKGQIYKPEDIPPPAV